LVLVDNASYSYAWQVENGIPIIPYYDNKDDKELISLEAYLKAMIGSDDVREFNK
jgi:CTD small phosphatase-like protein 2